MGERMPRAKDLRALSEEELKTKLQQAHRELWQHRLKAREGALQQVHALRGTKRQIARLSTLLNERRVGRPRRPQP